MFSSSSPYFILVGKHPVRVPVDQLLQWGAWYEWTSRTFARHVGRVIIPARKPFRKGGKMLAKVNRQRQQEIMVSTVFLGLDHNHFGGVPILFESMVFGGQHDQYQARYTNWDDAKAAHDKLVAKVKKPIAI